MAGASTATTATTANAATSRVALTLPGQATLALPVTGGIAAKSVDTAVRTEVANPATGQPTIFARRHVAGRALRATQHTATARIAKFVRAAVLIAGAIGAGSGHSVARQCVATRETR